MFNRFKQVFAVFGTIVASALLGILAPLSTSAAVSNPSPAAQVSFTFDDGFKSSLTKAAPALKSYGYTGTAYVTTDFIGKANYMTWNDTKTLQNSYGWEIGAHSKTHPLMTQLSEEQKEAEMAQSKQALQARDFNPTTFAPPFGDYNDQVTAASARHFTSMRGFHDTGYNQWPYNDQLIRVQQVQVGVSVSQVKGYINKAIQDKTWLVLVFHDIKDNPSSNPQDYHYSTNNLKNIAAYAKSKNVANRNVSKGLVTSDTNLIQNGSFAAGLSGWNTDTPANTTADNTTKGSSPGSVESAKLVPGTTNAHLYSAKINVSNSNQYLLKGYVHVTQHASGEAGFYIDEYDANGNWVSGQYKGAVRAMNAANINTTYVPSSAAVKQASLQIFADGNSGITAYVDNAQLFVTGGTTPAPVTNLVANGTFDAGISNGWSTDTAANVTADAASNGSPANPVNSVKFVGSDRNIHLFSPRVPVSATTTYSLSSYLKIAQISSGEVGYYIDEYDANGNWVSGQWKAERSTVSAGDVSFTYRPSSASVASASLQIYATNGSGATAYADNVVWLAL